MNNPRGKFTIPEAAKILNIENGRLREFVSRKYIDVAFPASGHGSKNYLSQIDLYRVKLFLYLKERGFNRVESSRIVNILHKYFKPELFNKKNLMFACFKRSPKNLTVKRKDIEKPFITNDGKIVSNIGITPGVRIITEDDLEKSFRTLFLTFEDNETSKMYDYSNTSFEDVLIVNMEKIIGQVDENL